MMRLEWTDPAVEDLQDIVDYIARDSSFYADAVAERIVLAVERLASFPRSGRLVPEADDLRIREIIVRGIVSCTG
jgi:plasmid stabilization system protein ParE